MKSDAISKAMMNERRRFMENLLLEKKNGEPIPGLPKFNARDSKGVHIPIFRPSNN